MVGGYNGAWSGGQTYARYAQRRPDGRPVVAGHDGRQEALQPNAAAMVSGPRRTGKIAPGLVVPDELVAPPAQGIGERGDRTPQRHDYGYVGAGYGLVSDTHEEALTEHSVDLGAVDATVKEAPAMLQSDRRVGWNGNARYSPLGHGSAAALGRGLNGLDMNNDPAAQHYAINTVGDHRVERKFPSRRIWTRYLTPWRMRVAAQPVVSKPSEASPATSWAPTATVARTGKTSPPMVRRTPRPWTEGVTRDDQAGDIAAAGEPSWGL